MNYLSTDFLGANELNFYFYSFLEAKDLASLRIVNRFFRNNIDSRVEQLRSKFIGKIQKGYAINKQKQEKLLPQSFLQILHYLKIPLEENSVIKMLSLLQISVEKYAKKEPLQLNPLHDLYISIHSKEINSWKINSSSQITFKEMIHQSKLEEQIKKLRKNLNKINFNG
ncbi:MAG: hypothetical protein Tsb0015_08830 [Simkaniaceae bacterium]